MLLEDLNAILQGFLHGGRDGQRNNLAPMHHACGESKVIWA